MKLTRHQILSIAVQAHCDERTVRKALSGKKPRYLSEQRARVLDALRELKKKDVDTVPQGC